MRSGLCSRSERKWKSPDTSTAMRVTSASDQLRIAVTDCRGTRSLCANNIVAEIASAASGFIAWRLSRDVAHGTVRLDYFHDVGGTSFGGLDGLGRRGRRNSFGRNGLSGQLQLAPHQDQVILRFGERRPSAVACYRAFAGIVSRQRQRVVFAVKIQQIAQIPGPALDVFDRVEGIIDAETPGRGGNQLHQSQRALTRNRVRVVVALHFDDRMDQLRRQRVLGGNTAHDFINAGGRRDGLRIGRGGAHHAWRHYGFGHSDFGDGLGADHHASHQFPGSQIWTYHTGNPLRNTRTGAKQYAGGETRNRQFKTKLAKNFSFKVIPKTRPPRGPAPNPRRLKQA